MKSRNSCARNEIMKVCTILAEKENLQVSIKEAGKGALITGFGAFAGGLLAGPCGLAIGGVLSSVTAAYLGRGKYKSVVQVLSEDLTPQQKNKLMDAMENLFSNIKAEDVTALVMLILTSASLKEQVLTVLGDFLLKELQMQMIK